MVHFNIAMAVYGEAVDLLGHCRFQEVYIQKLNKKCAEIQACCGISMINKV